MSSRNIFLTGFLGLLGAIIVGIGEFYLHYSPELLEAEGDFGFFKTVPYNHLIKGHFISVFGVPFYFAGYYHIYHMLGGKQNKLALPTFLLGVLAFTIGGFWITSRAFFGTIVQLQPDIEAATYQTILDNYALISESLVQVLRVLVLLISVVFITAILKGNTHYQKWMALFNPILLLLLVFALFFTLPSIGKYLGPIAMNVAHFFMFGASLYQFSLYQNRPDVV